MLPPKHTTDDLPLEVYCIVTVMFHTNFKMKSMSLWETSSLPKHTPYREPQKARIHRKMLNFTSGQLLWQTPLSPTHSPPSQSQDGEAHKPRKTEAPWNKQRKAVIWHFLPDSSFCPAKVPLGRAVAQPWPDYFPARSGLQNFKVDP